MQTKKHKYYKPIIFLHTINIEDDIFSTWTDKMIYPFHEGLRVIA
ncbi:hypothetical protein [Sphingobacterium litopenaei]|nr:hypothetical protein [Sphingobacterium litopenaei]